MLYRRRIANALAIEKSRGRETAKDMLAVGKLYQGSYIDDALGATPGYPNEEGNRNRAGQVAVYSSAGRIEWRTGGRSGGPRSVNSRRGTSWTGSEVSYHRGTWV